MEGMGEWNYSDPALDGNKYMKHVEFGKFTLDFTSDSETSEIKKK